jgi:hypothetical protein
MIPAGMTSESLLALLRPIALRVATLDLSAPEAARSELAAAFPDTSAIRAAMLEARAEGWLCPRTAPILPGTAAEGSEVKFGRLSRSSPDLGGCSIDVVDMTGEGAPHRHPNGEANLAFAVETGEGEEGPRFLGFPEGFSVFAPGSRHVPTVTGGRMVIAYFLPGGAIVFE